MTLSILCVTRAEPFALPFLRALSDAAEVLEAEYVLLLDAVPASRPFGYAPETADYQIRRVRSAGYIESVLDEGVGCCNGTYVLRVDDDERISPALLQWLEGRCYEGADHWAFPRANLWGDERSVLVNPPLWPDLQTRLSVKSKAGGRHGVHDGSPYGTGTIAPVVIEHHKYLVKSRAEREAQARGYDALRSGAGTAPHFWPFMVPEDAFLEVALSPLDDGDAGMIERAERRVLTVAR